MKKLKSLAISILSCVVGGLLGWVIAHQIGCYCGEIKTAALKFLPMSREELVRQIETMTWEIEERDNEIITLMERIKELTVSQ